MPLTDAKQRNIKGPRKKRDPKARMKPYSDSQKLELIKLWKVTGNLTVSAASLNIPLPTARSWRYSDWWREMSEELDIGENMALSARLKGLASKALGITEDRLDNGDFHVDSRTGEVIRKPVSLRDSARVATDLIKQTEVLDKRPREVASEEKTSDILEKLMDKFTEVAAKVNQKPVVNVTDVILGKELEPKKEDDVDESD